MLLKRSLWGIPMDNAVFNRLMIGDVAEDLGEFG